MIVFVRYVAAPGNADVVEEAFGIGEASECPEQALSQQSLPRNPNART
jgi:hypothetical protein